MDKILQMLLLQQALNDETNGLDWEQGITKNGKQIHWKRCIYLECAELIESYPWKHWKDIDAPADYANIKIETVDIWHFIMSQGLEDYKIKNLGTIEDLAKQIHTLPNYMNFTHVIKETEKDYYQQIKVVEKLVQTLFCKHSTKALMETFIDIAIQSGLNLDRLYTLYIGKNILNKFRQNHGYKEGLYQKIWNGKEDNVIMQNILEEKSDISPDALYYALEALYPNKE